jgi:hypothetical protein
MNFHSDKNAISAIVAQSLKWCNSDHASVIRNETRVRLEGSAVKTNTADA